MSIEISTKVDLDSLIYDLVVQASEKELVQFIIDLDAEMSDWQFTEKVYKHFKSEHKTYKRDVKGFE